MCTCSKVFAKISCEECGFTIGAVEDGSGIPCDCAEHSIPYPVDHPHDCCCITCYAKQLLDIEEDGRELCRQNALEIIDGIPSAKTLDRWFTWNSPPRFAL
jgi:hypothetical protein